MTLQILPFVLKQELARACLESDKNIQRPVQYFLPFSEMTSTVLASYDQLQWCYFWWEKEIFFQEAADSNDFFTGPFQ